MDKGSGSRVTGGLTSILITGGRGQLGSELHHLLERAGVPHEALDLPELDVTDERSVFAAVQQLASASRREGLRPRQGQLVPLVIHTAAYTSVDGAEDPAEREKVFRINSAGTRIVAEACARAHVPMVYISTDYVFDGEKRVPYEVDDPPQPLNVYGASKLLGEESVREVLAEHYIIRTAWLFGVRGRNFPRSMLEAAKANARTGKPLQVVNDQVGCPTNARDLAEAILLLAGIPVVTPNGVRRRRGSRSGSIVNGDQPSGLERDAQFPIKVTRHVETLVPAAPFGTYHVTNSGSCSWYEFAQEIVLQAGWQVRVQPIGSSNLNRPAKRPTYSALSVAKLRELGLEIRPWQEALAAFLEELRTDSPQLFPPTE